MKNGQLPDHWQLWLWIGLAAFILAALARQSAIDAGGMSGFNANLIFVGVLVVIGLLYLAFHEFFAKEFGTGIAKSLEKIFKWLGFKQKKIQEQIIELVALTVAEPMPRLAIRLKQMLLELPLL